MLVTPPTQPPRQDPTPPSTSVMPAQHPDNGPQSEQKDGGSTEGEHLQHTPKMLPKQAPMSPKQLVKKWPIDAPHSWQLSPQFPKHKSSAPSCAPQHLPHSSPHPDGCASAVFVVVSAVATKRPTRGRAATTHHAGDGFTAAAVSDVTHEVLNVEAAQTSKIGHGADVLHRTRNIAECHSRADAGTKHKHAGGGTCC